jgi:hypothetical protein
MTSQNQDGNIRDSAWRILAEEVAQEHDPEKLLEIVTSLNRALEEAARANSEREGDRPSRQVRRSA